jgi:HAD superfamily hydrolase (TIGR01490 family)
MPGSMDLALFDLDHTLLPLDSDTEWTRFLARIGVLDGALVEHASAGFVRDYEAGALDIDAFLRFQLAPLAAHPRGTLLGWRARFVDEVIRPAVLPPALELVERHRARGDLLALVTATNAFVTAPIARLFGIEHLVATALEERAGAFTGRPAGTPSFREGKVARTTEWLGTLGRGLHAFERSWCYGDSRNDLPLLECVTDPVATNPDDVLHATAIERGWRVVRLFEGRA